MLRVDLIVLAGGRGSRLGGALKPAVEVAGRPLLSRVLDARPLAQQAVVVGPAGARPAAIDEHGNAVSVVWALEDPPFGGPVAGLAAGLAALDAAYEGALEAAHDADAPMLDEPAGWVLVLACDLPYGAVAARTLLSCTSALLQIGDADKVDGVHFTDLHGRSQWLAALYRAPALRAAMARLGDRVGDASMRMLLEGLHLTALMDESTASTDVDTWEDVENSTARLTGAPDQVARPEE